MIFSLNDSVKRVEQLHFLSTGTSFPKLGVLPDTNCPLSPPQLVNLQRPSYPVRTSSCPVRRLGLHVVHLVLSRLCFEKLEDWERFFVSSRSLIYLSFHQTFNFNVYELLLFITKNRCTVNYRNYFH